MDGFFSILLDAADGALCFPIWVAGIERGGLPAFRSRTPPYHSKNDIVPEPTFEARSVVITMTPFDTNLRSGNSAGHGKESNRRYR